MNMRRGLFRVWVLVTAFWLLGCIWFGAKNWHWFEANRVYEVADANDEKYQVEAAPDTPLDEIVLFVQKSAGSKRLRKECEKDWRGPWCEDRKSTRLNSSHQIISYAVFCLKKKNMIIKI